MKDFLQRNLPVALVVLPLLGGCASDSCERLVYETPPSQTAPLVMPEGVPAPAERGDLAVPARPADARVADRCLAQPPMTLPEDVLVAPEEPEEEAPAEEPART